MKTLFCIGIALGAGLTLHAQEAAPQPTVPPGPLLNKAPALAQWTVTIKSAGETPAASPAPGEKGEKPQPPAGNERIGVVQTGNIRHEVRVRGTQVTSDAWSVDGTYITVDPSTKVARVSAGGGASTQDFPEIAWVSAKNFSGIQDVSGKKCIVFKDKLETYADSGEKIDAVAYVDLETRLPVAMQKGDVYTYQFGAPPQAPLTPPQNIAEALEKYRKRLQRAGATPIP